MITPKEKKMWEFCTFLAIAFAIFCCLNVILYVIYNNRDESQDSLIVVVVVFFVVIKL